MRISKTNRDTCLDKPHPLKEAGLLSIQAESQTVPLYTYLHASHVYVCALNEELLFHVQFCSATMGKAEALCILTFLLYW